MQSEWYEAVDPPRVLTDGSTWASVLRFCLRIPHRPNSIFRTELNHDLPNSRGGEIAFSSLSREDAATAFRELQACCRNLHAGNGACPNDEEWLRIESESLVSWAERKGRIFDSTTFVALTGHLRELGGGTEHRVFFWQHQEVARVLKITKAPFFGLQGRLLAYVNNIARSNRLFNDDIRLEGVIKDGEIVALIVSQPFLIGRSPNLAEIAEWFAAQGYTSVGHYRWKNDDLGIEITDAHTGNFILVETGELIPIDLQVLHGGDDEAQEHML